MSQEAPDEQAVVGALGDVLASRSFANAPRCRELLSFVVTESLAGRGHLLNERVIARSALGRPATLDTRTDSAARVQARRTRELLDRYYAEEGRDDAVRISVPTGQYAATFRRFAPTADDLVPEPCPPTATVGPIVAVMQLRHRSGGIDRRVAVGLTETLVQTLSRFPGLRVVGPIIGDSSGEPQADAVLAGTRTGAHAVLHGATWTNDDAVRVSVHLTDTGERRVRWSDTFSHPMAEFTGFGAEDEIVRSVAGIVGDVNGVVWQAPLRPEATHGDPEVARALWRYYAFVNHLDPRELPEVLDGLRGAAEREPDNALVLASLGFCCGIDVTMNGTSATTGIEQADDLARRALRHDPSSAVAHNVLGIVGLVRGNHPGARRHAEEALRLAPYHPANTYVAGLTLATADEWERGVLVMREAIRLNPYGPNHRHVMVAIDALLRDDVAEAMAEASLLDIPGHVWGPVIRAVCFDALALHDQARDQMAEALLVAPDLLDRPHEVLTSSPNVPLKASTHVADRVARFASGT